MDEFVCWVRRHLGFLVIKWVKIPLPLAVIFIVSNDFEWRDLLWVHCSEKYDTDWRSKVAIFSYLAFWVYITTIMICWIVRVVVRLWRCIEAMGKSWEAGKEFVMMILQMWVAVLGFMGIELLSDPESGVAKYSENSFMLIVVLDSLMKFAMMLCSGWLLAGPYWLWIMRSDRRWENERGTTRRC